MIDPLPPASARGGVADEGLRVLVVGFPYEMSATPFDGLVTRRRAFVTAVAARHAVSIYLLRPPGDVSAVVPELRELVIGERSIEMAGGGTRASRLAGVARMLWRREVPEWEQGVLAAASAARPDVALLIGPWLDQEFAVFTSAFPSVHLLEEDVWADQDLASQSLQGRALRRLEVWARKTALPSPDAVVVISEGERAAARRRFRRTQIVVVPHSVPSSWGAVAGTASEGDSLVVAGALAQGRNAEGLREVLHELSRERPPGLRVELVSGLGLHPMLEPYLELTWITVLEGVENLWSRYRGARLTLVPAKRATGVKTTILQGWVAGCPVVTYAGSAATLPGFSDAMLVGVSAQDVASCIAQAWSDDGLRTKLAARGRAAIEGHFNETVAAERLLALLAEVGGRA
jgi:glycosyltransferase involved in cell wall biosynthesis